MNEEEILVIGVGNPFRRDDGAGIEVVRRLEALDLPGVRTSEQSGEGAALMAAWEGSGDVILIDAVSSGAPAGSVHQLSAHEQEIPSDFFHYSTHAFSVAEAVEMARALNRLPERIWIYGIEGKDYGTGMGFSPPVDDAVGSVVESIRQRIEEIRRHGTGLPAS